MLPPSVVWCFALLAVACTTSPAPGAGPSEDSFPEADSGGVDSGSGDTGADTADTADSNDSGPAYALPDEDLTDEVCARVRWDVASRNWYDDTYQNLYAEDVTDAAGRLRWHILYDANLDWSDAHRYTYVYDEAGRRIQELETLDGDGAVLNADVYAWSAEGWLTEDWLDDFADGSFDAVWTWTYDAEGRVVDEAWRPEPDVGDWNRTATTWTPGGRTEVQEFVSEGVVSSRQTRTYDLQGLPLTDQNDRDADGVTDIEYAWTRDADGKLLDYEEHGSSGSLVEYTRYVYDDLGLLVSEAGLDSLEGDYQTDYQYGASGELLDARTTYGDGSEDLHVVYAYDDELRAVLAVTTFEYDSGGVTWRGVETWTYDAEGRLIADEWDEDEDGTVDWWDYVTFDTVPC